MKGKSLLLLHLAWVIGRLISMRLFLFTLITTITACSSPKGPSFILLDNDLYSQAFDAAVESVKNEGYKPILLDRRLGTITTHPLVGGSYLEPWKSKNLNTRQYLENTLSLQRRTVRFDFIPVTIPDTEKSLDLDLRGPNLLSPSIIDLTDHSGPIELQVSVYVERHYTKGKKISTSSFRKNSQDITTLGSNEILATMPNSFWTPISRDISKEQLLLTTIEQILNSN